MNDYLERDLQDGTDPYLYTADTLDVDIAASMTADEFAVEMQRLRNLRALQQRAETRRRTHRRVLKSGAAHLVRRSFAKTNCSAAALKLRQFQR